jgi:UDP-glucose 4-epimerase
MTEKVLVIGGSGFFGSELIRIITEKPYENFVFYQGFFRNKPTYLRSCHVNLLDQSSIERTVENFDIIINCSGQITSPIELCYEQNTSGIHLLSQAVRKYNRYLIHLSSAVVYGSAIFPNELASLNFETPYAACKAFAEYIIVRELSIQNYLILRVPNIYGGDQMKGLFAYIKRSYFSDKILEFNNDGQQKKSFVHIEDSIFGLLELMQRNSSGIYNLPVSDVRTIKEIVLTVERLTNCQFHTSFEKSGRLEILDGLNSSKFDSQTGYKIRHNLDGYINSSFLQ